MMAGIKRPENKFNYSPQSSVEVKDEYSYTAVPLYDFMVRMGTNLPFFLCYLSCQLVFSFMKCLVYCHLLLGNKHCVA